jgi:hypothetical protein
MDVRASHIPDVDEPEVDREEERTEIHLEKAGEE